MTSIHVNVSLNNIILRKKKTFLEEYTQPEVIYSKTCMNKQYTIYTHKQHLEKLQR